MLAIVVGLAIVAINSTPHASRKICAPWGVIFILFPPFPLSSQLSSVFFHHDVKPLYYLSTNNWRDLPLLRGKV